MINWLDNPIPKSVNDHLVALDIDAIPFCDFLISLGYKRGVDFFDPRGPVEWDDGPVADIVVEAYMERWQC